MEYSRFTGTTAVDVAMFSAFLFFSQFFVSVFFQFIKNYEMHNI